MKKEILQVKHETNVIFNEQGSECHILVFVAKVYGGKYVGKMCISLREN